MSKPHDGYSFGRLLEKKPLTGMAKRIRRDVDEAVRWRTARAKALRVRWELFKKRKA